MKNSNSIRILSGILTAMTFGLFLLFGTLTSSDFPRGLYSPPDGWVNKWPEFDSLNQNIVINGRWAWHHDSGSTVYDYLDSLDKYDMKAILRKGYRDTSFTNEDSIPYFVEYYSYGNYNQLQVEWNYEEAERKLEEEGTGYYYFLH